jgi:hypothetical protein
MLVIGVPSFFLHFSNSGTKCKVQGLLAKPGACTLLRLCLPLPLARYASVNQHQHQHCRNLQEVCNIVACGKNFPELLMALTHKNALPSASAMCSVIFVLADDRKIPDAFSHSWWWSPKRKYEKEKHEKKYEFKNSIHASGNVPGNEGGRWDGTEKRINYSEETA